LIATPLKTGDFKTSAKVTLSDANGFEIGWTDPGNNGWEAFDPSTYPLEIDTNLTLPSSVFIHPGTDPVNDDPTIQYQGQSVVCPLKGFHGGPAQCTAQFKCDKKMTNPNGFTPGTCSITMTQTDQTPTQTDPNIIVQPASSDNRYVVTVGITDGNGALADSVQNTVAGDKYPLTMQGKLPKNITMTPEAQNDYVQFNYDTLRWTSNVKGSPGCHKTDWAPNVEFPGYPVSISKRFRLLGIVSEERS
jgi:hypothetical protein